MEYDNPAYPNENLAKRIQRIKESVGSGPAFWDDIHLLLQKEDLLWLIDLIDQRFDT
jgi:hypothetical protein